MSPATSRMRILMASDFYPPFIGGAERQVQLLARQLSSQGHNVSVATVWHDDLPARERDGSLAIHRLRGLATRVPWFSGSPGRRYHPPVPDPAIVLELVSLIRRQRPHIVHANGWIAYSCAVAALVAGVPLVVSARDYGYGCATRTLLQNGERLSSGPAVGKCLQCATRRYGPAKGAAAVGGVFAGRPLLRRALGGVHSVSRYVESIIKRDLFVTPRASEGVLFKVIPDIVQLSDEDASDGGTRQLNLGAWSDKLPPEPFVLFVGALQPHKGIGVLFDAHGDLARCSSSDRIPPLVLMGTRWPDTPRSFPEGVTVLEDVPHPVVMEAWDRALFGVTPSIWPDPLPGVVREAMSKGKAVIGSAVGGNLDMIIPEKTGLLVPPGDRAALSSAMQRLIEDAPLRERLGEAAQTSVSGYAEAAIGERFIDFYGSIIRRRMLPGEATP